MLPFNQVRVPLTHLLFLLWHHFLSNNHSLYEIEPNPLELKHLPCDATSKAQEAYLINVGQTLEPKGITRFEEM